jgi:hypothetical protein
MTRIKLLAATARLSVIIATSVLAQVIQGHCAYWLGRRQLLGRGVEKGLTLDDLLARSEAVFLPCERERRYRVYANAGT